MALSSGQTPSFLNLMFQTSFFKNQVQMDRAYKELWISFFIAYLFSNHFKDLLAFFSREQTENSFETNANTFSRIIHCRKLKMNEKKTRVSSNFNSQGWQCTVFRKAYILPGSGFHEFLYSIIESFKKNCEIAEFIPNQLSLKKKKN